MGEILGCEEPHPLQEDDITLDDKGKKLSNIAVNQINGNDNNQKLTVV